MPTTSCPHCGRKIQFELHEIDTVFQCSHCNGKFTPGGGAVAKGPALEDPESVSWESSAPPVRLGTSAGSVSPQPYSTYPDDSPEPWFYRFIETYANVTMLLGIISIVFGLLFAIFFVIKENKDSPGWAALMLLVAVVEAGMLILILLLAVAFILLIVDAGRNLRMLRREQSVATEILVRMEGRKKV